MWCWAGGHDDHDDLDADDNDDNDDECDVEQVVFIAGRQAVPTDVGGWSPIIVPNHQT